MSSRARSPAFARCLWLAPILVAISGCTSLGSLMSPYSEKFSCKNSDHGQCIHPDKAYADAVAGWASRSDPSVTRDKAMLKLAQDGGRDGARAAPTTARARAEAANPSAYQGYRDSVYRELQGLIEAPVTPMLKASRTVRTLIMPYADRARPDRLYMPRYVYSLLDRPQWVIGDYLVDPVSSAAKAPILDQVQDKPLDETALEGPRP
ncbi:TraV family lipoprotein [Sphingobium sp. D43FB]|uniref:TraV family lipoprotein n=1 Tax=Sphingobium sp. D43FB TaxID=2017595 RepID=UPI000BB592A6|nr:TraV family lipoprotein [Sphingobium sp. D43FB]PBN43541.1 conjugal transfer protein TraV [Sphingobium sp. D43FB]